MLGILILVVTWVQALLLRLKLHIVLLLVVLLLLLSKKEVHGNFQLVNLVDLNSILDVFLLSILGHDNPPAAGASSGLSEDSSVHDVGYQIPRRFAILSSRVALPASGATQSMVTFLDAAENRLICRQSTH